MAETPASAARLDLESLIAEAAGSAALLTLVSENLSSCKLAPDDLRLLGWALDPSVSYAGVWVTTAS